MNISHNETQALLAIVKSEYQDGNPVDHAVWTSYVNPFSNRKTFSGVIASLSKKGLVACGGSSDDANYEAGCDGTTLAITQAGWDALVAEYMAKYQAEGQSTKQAHQSALAVLS